MGFLLFLTHSLLVSSIGESSSDEPPLLTEIKLDTSEDNYETISTDEYNFLFFSLLYTQYPQLRSLDPDDIINHINKTKSSGYEGSIYEEIAECTNNLLIQILSYNYDMAEKGIDVDVSGQISDYFDKKRAEALSSGLEFNEYLRAYYKVNESTPIRQIAKKYLSYIEYKNNYIPKMLEKELNDDYYTQEYNKSPSKYNLYSVSYLVYQFPTLNDDKESIVNEITQIYEKVHSHNDMEKLSKEFESTHPYSDENNISYGSILKINNELSYEKLNELDPSIADYIINPELAVDTAALFELSNRLVLIYYNGSRVNDSLTYSGYSCDADNNQTAFYNSSLEELLIYSEPPTIFPYEYSMGKTKIVLEKKGLPYWKQIGRAHV